MKTNETIAVTIKEGTALLQGRTYPIRDKLKDYGARWDGKLNAWAISPARLPDIRSVAESRGIRLIETGASLTQAPATTASQSHPNHLLDPQLLKILERIATALETIAIECIRKGG